MNILQNVRLATQKAFYKKGKALAIILPTTLLTLLIILLNSESNSLLSVIQDKVFKVIDSTLSVVEVTKASTNTQQQFSPGGFGVQQQVDDQYYQEDLAKVKALPEVETAQLVESLPLNRIVISELGGAKDISINSLSGLDATFAKNYTTTDFTYTESQPIPIILSSNDLIETYTDWQGKDSISFTMRRPGSTVSSSETNPFQSMIDANPVKTRTLSYVTSDLIGKEITVKVGGLNPISEVNRTNSQGTVTFTKLTADELVTKENERKTNISTYWDYDKISTPQTYTFKIVGIIESGTQFRTYIPQNAVTTIMNAYYSNYAAARNSTVFVDNTARSFNGALYDGTNIKYDSNLFSQALFSGFRNQLNNIDAQQQNAANGRTFQPNQRIEINGPRGVDSSVNIPGLIYNYDTSTPTLGTDVQVEEAKRVYATQTISIKLRDGVNRDNFFSEMTNAGFTVKDTSRASDFNTVRNNLGNWINWIIIIAIVLVSIFVAVIISKFIADSKKEYGIMRALGMKKGGIFIQTFLQIIVQLFVGILIGLVSSTLIVYSIAPIIASKSQDLITLILGKATTLTTNINSSAFTSMVLDKSGIMLGISVVVFIILAVISANTATKVSPVSAIRE